MGWFSSCEHEYKPESNDLYKWATHKCEKCGKVERCVAEFISDVMGGDYSCITCNQNLNHTKNASKANS